MVCQEMRAGDSRSWNDAVHGVCSTRCMLYFGVCCIPCMQYSVSAVLGVNS